MADRKPPANPHLAGHSAPTHRTEPEGEDEAHVAFGYLRGIKDRSFSLELRFRNGNSMWFPYAWLGPCRYDPSQGILLKFSGDLIYLVLIQGSNLSLPLSESNMSLPNGLQRHRIIWLREMSEEDARQAGTSLPTIDRILVAEFDSPADGSAWLEKTGVGSLAGTKPGD